MKLQSEDHAPHHHELSLSRRQFGLIASGTLAASQLADGTGTSSKKKKKKKKKKPVEICHAGQTMVVSPGSLTAHLAHGDTRGPCQATTTTTTVDPGENPGCFAGNYVKKNEGRRFVQTFRTLRTGFIAGGRCTVTTPDNNTSYLVEILSTSNGDPTSTVLTSDTILVEEGSTFSLSVTGDFIPALAVNKDDLYALAITVLGSADLIIDVSPNTCGGTLYRDQNASGDFVEVAGSIRFSIWNPPVDPWD